jgi:hypothetical protein
MSKTVRRLSLVFLSLLFGAFGSLYVGKHRWEYEQQQFGKDMKASGFYITHASPNTNAWQIVGFLLFFVSLSVALAAFLLWNQDRKESG